MFKYTDQLGVTLSFKERPKRIISIVPSQSELLSDLGLREELVGITKFCVHPSEMFEAVQHVGGTKKLNLEIIRKLKPDLIIGNKEENDKGQIELLRKEFNVWMSDIYNFEDACAMMKSIGDIFNKKAAADLIVKNLILSLTNIKNLFKNNRIAYFIWNKPYMVAADATFINHVLSHLGFENAFSCLTRYPEVSDELLKQINPGVCLLSSEPFPFKEKHICEIQRKLPDAKILIVDGEVFSWYGTRLLHLEKYLKSIPLKH